MTDTDDQTALERLRGLLGTDLSVRELRDEAREQAREQALDDLDYDD